MPGTGPVVLGVDAHEPRDQRIPLAALWPGGEVRELAERIAVASDPGATLERLAGQRLRRAGPVDRLITTVAGRLRAGANVAATAGAAGLSERQLHRRCLAAFGYGPSTLSRTLRLTRAVRLARTGMPVAAVAAAAGYADQSHLARDVKELAGVPITEPRVRSDRARSGRVLRR